MTFEAVSKVSDIAVLFLVPIYMYLLIGALRARRQVQTLEQQLRGLNEDLTKQAQVMMAGLEFFSHITRCRVCTSNHPRLCPIGKTMLGDYLSKEQQSGVLSGVKQ